MIITDQTIDEKTGLPILLSNKKTHIERAIKRNKEEHQKLYGQLIVLGGEIRDWFNHQA